MKSTQDCMIQAIVEIITNEIASDTTEYLARLSSGLIVWIGYVVGNELGMYSASTGQFGCDVGYPCVTSCIVEFADEFGYSISDEVLKSGG